MPIGKLETFEIGTHKWDAYCRRVKQFITLNKIANELQVAVLVTHVGVACYELMCDLYLHELPENKEFDELVKIVQDQLEPQSEVLGSRVHTRFLIDLKIKFINKMPDQIPGFAIQCDWNDVARLPRQQFWITSKYLNESSTHENITTSQADGKIKLNCSDNYEYVSHGNLNLVLKHVRSEVKVAFVAPTKAHKVHAKGVLSVDSAENALAISSCEGDRLLVWDSRTSEILLDLKGHGGPAYRCRFFPSGQVVISAGADGSCRIWSAEDGLNPVTLIGHKMAVTDLEVIEKGRNVVTVSKDGSAKLWDVGQSSVLADIIKEKGPLNCCVVATTTQVAEVESEREIGTENKLLIACCESGLVTCAHIARRQEIFSKQLDSPCNACAVIDHSTVVIGCHDGKVIQLNLQDGSILRQWHESASPVLSLTSLPNQMFILGRQDGNCTVISLQESLSSLRVYLTGSDCDGIRDISFNGKWVFTGCRDSLVRKYDFNQVNVHFK